MKIQPATVGPLLGHTSSTEARIWLRGDLQQTSSGVRRAFGVVQLKAKKAAKFGPPKFVPLMPHFDMTGVTVFAGLKELEDYVYQAGWFFADSELENVEKIQGLDWSACDTIAFKTGTSDAKADRSYIVGSCRYLLKLFGGTIWDERGDKAFRSILEQIEEKDSRVDGLMLMGDQIYADDLNILFPIKTIDQFFERYRTVFSQQYFRRLTGRVPTYMILDDHEIEDNWPAKASDKDWVTLYPHAIHAYQVYQCSHSPLFDVDKDGRLTGTLSKFWYQFQDGCCEWFVMDCRNERVWSEAPAKRRMVKPAQMNALLKWLGDGSGKVKVIVTSVPFFPDMESESEDKWSGFLNERTQILDHILENKIPKVVFLSGDVHCSFSVELTSPEDTSFKVLSVVSSSFFWPYPHMDEADFILDGELPTPASKHKYKVGAASKVYSEDNFARLAFHPDGVDISFFDRKGGRLGKTVQRRF